MTQRLIDYSIEDDNRRAVKPLHAAMRHERTIDQRMQLQPRLRDIPTRLVRRRSFTETPRGHVRLEREAHSRETRRG